MARFVIAGRADCPRFAKAELLGDSLHHSLPNFKVHKVVKRPEEWDSFVSDLISQTRWNLRSKRSPIIWRELVNRGGKGVLVGDENDFQEYARAYYNVKQPHSSEHLKNVAQDNVRYKAETDDELAAEKSRFNPLRVVLSNASSEFAYQLAPLLLGGDCFGKTELAVRLFDPNPSRNDALRGLAMELEDTAAPLLREVTTTQDAESAFVDAHVVLLLDHIERDPSEKRRYWLKRYAQLFDSYARLLAKQSSKRTIVVVAGAPDAPLNLNLRVLIEGLRRERSLIHPRNVVGVPRLLENIAGRLLAEKLNVNPAQIVDLLLWGNVGGKSFLDVRFARIFRYPGAIYGPSSFAQPLGDVFWQKRFIAKELNSSIEARPKDFRAKLEKHPASAQAAAVARTLTDWHNGLRSARFSSLVVQADGTYGVPAGTIFSLPVSFHPRGYWRLVEDLELAVEVKAKIAESLVDLSAQWEEAFGPTPPPTPPPPEPSALPQVIEAPPPAGEVAMPELADQSAAPQGEGEEDQMALGAPDEAPDPDAEAEGDGDALIPDDNEPLGDQ